MTLPASLAPMSDDNSRDTTDTMNRRSILATVGTTVALGLAGCGGGGGGDGNDDGGDGNDDGGDDTDPSGNTDGNAQQSGPDSNGGGGDGCPAVPSSYTTEDVPTMLSNDPAANIGVPSSGASIESGSGTLRVRYDIGSVIVQSRNSTNTTVEEELMEGLSDVTDEYDLPSGARAQREGTGTSERVDVYIPSGSDVVYVSVAASGTDECLEGSLGTIRDEMVNSIQVN